jgi:hypothetical protein
MAVLAALMIWVSQALAATPQTAAPAAKPAAAAESPATAYVGAESVPHWHTIQGDWADAFHHPFDGLEMGLDVRLREVYTRNMFTLNDQFGDPTANSNHMQWQRYRTRWSTIWTMAPDVTFNTRLVWEFWSISSPEQMPVAGLRPLAQRDTDFRELIFDTMNIKWKNAFDAPMTLTVGRQDIVLGTGWLVLDGTPGDGSRTIFFDAVRATIDLQEKTKLDLIGIAQSDDERGWMTPINHRDYLHLTQKTDETGFIAYLTDKSFENTQLEGYYIYKKENPSDWAQFSESWWTATPGKAQEIHTFGGRIAQKLDENWSYSVEAAKQFGHRDMGTSTHDFESMRGLGSNDKLTYAFNDDLKNELRLMYEYLSGDNKATKGSERFDTLWGDWPQYQRGGDLQSYIWTFEGALGEVSNLHRTGIGHTFHPNKEWTMSTDYNLLWADQNGSAQSVAPSILAISNDGYFRGQMISGIATYQCCKNFLTHFMLDYFIPGNYYRESNRDTAMFARINVEWTF